MGRIAEILGFKAYSPENPAVPLGSWGVLAESFGLSATDAGVVVNERLAMHLPVVYACTLAIAEGMAAIPLHLLTKNEKGIDKAVDNPLYKLLHDEPNPMMSSFTFRKTMQGNCCLWGNAYAEIQWDGAGRCRGLWPRLPDRTHPTVRDGKLYYVTTDTPDRTERYTAAEDMLHVMGFSYDGLTGLSPIATARQAIGLGLATEKYGSQWFGNGSRPGGILTAPAGTVLRDDQIARLRESAKSLYGGSNAHSIAVLDGGLTWTPMSIPPEDAQFLQTRKFQIEDIARLFRVPLHMIGELARATNNNIEHQSLEFVKFTLAPWAECWEQEINRKLLKRTPYFVNFDMDALQRGDFLTRMQGFRELRNIAVVNADEIRGAIGLNRIPEGQGGDKYIMQSNNTTLEKIGESVPDPTKPTTEGEPPDNKAAAALLRRVARAIDKE